MTKADYVPNWHHGDPCSSQSFGIAVESTGKAPQQRETVMKAVRSLPGHTSKEIAEKTGLDRHMIARRLPELLRANRVERTEQGQCRWYPVKEGKQVELKLWDER